MTWVYKFESTKPKEKFKKGFRFMGVYDSNRVNGVGVWLWSDKSKKWSTGIEDWDTNLLNIRTFKAFKRHLNKHPELQKSGIEADLMGWIGYTITAVWEE